MLTSFLFCGILAFVDFSVIVVSATIDLLSWHRSICHRNISCTHHVHVLYALQARVLHRPLTSFLYQFQTENPSTQYKFGS